MNKILIIQATFYKDISSLLLEGAIAKILQNKYQYDVIEVSGALEIPSAISIAQYSNIYSGYVALGCVIRGETSHYEIVCNQSARGIMDLSIQKNLAIGNGILTVENHEQAIKRADMKMLDKGGFAVEACLNIINIKNKYNL
jgi:6,7-dimethyl-8-ribityllumazine synthase